LPKRGEHAAIATATFKTVTKDGYMFLCSGRTYQNYLLKGLEKLVKWEMDKALIKYPIHRNQHGFQRGKSTDSAISKTVDFIEKFIMKNMKCLGIFLDISAAFDSIDPTFVRREILEHEGDKNWVDWYYDYMTHREIYIDLQGEKSSFSTGVGFPQGGVCSAKFWLVAFNEAVEIINKYGMEGNAYADDCSALIGGDTYPNMKKSMECMLKELVQWGKGCGLSFNASKTVVVLFHKKAQRTPKCVKMDGVQLKFSEVTYLGIQLQRRLNWKNHIEKKLVKAKNSLFKAPSLTTDRHDPKPRLMKWVFEGIIKPIITYGCVVWGKDIEK
jgi:hypothetical protein